MTPSINDVNEPVSPTLDPPGDETSPPLRFDVKGTLREHPWIAAIMLACIVGGALAGPRLLDEDWTLLRQVAAGGFLGAWVGLTITVTKMIG